MNPYFDKFMKEHYFEKGIETICESEFCHQMGDYFSHDGLPVLFSDILYTLLGFAFSKGPHIENTVDFYRRLKADSQSYLKMK